ncbi:hypothetical protein [[Mycobacterium] nativiensis]|uniref:Uncharacterized protein n=1 Tax=[Mycobacterium] nativiensis TaxID=2855503 RepID=A0ABU5XTK1_9MYCO|nr:hypothetical protein [Mycolicibacter sp. MYC340]MEB3031088.1 hypothetical protein [Mycolicibacter sp. MYC340]
MDKLELAALAAAEGTEALHRPQAKTWNVGPDAAVDFGTPGRHPFDDTTITHWSHDG